MDQTVISDEVSEVTFNLYTSKEIRELSVKEINNHITFDSLSNPILGGLYDPALGPIDSNTLCSTCHLIQNECPGHLGHIELPLPVYNPLLFPLMFKILKLKCFSCHRFRIKSTKSFIYRIKLLLLENNYLQEAITLDDILIQKNGDVDETDLQMLTRQENYLKDKENILILNYNTNSNTNNNKRTIEVNRMNIIQSFLLSIPKKCENCQCISPTLRHDSFIKIYSKQLSLRSIKLNKLTNRTISSAFDNEFKNNILIHNNNNNNNNKQNELNGKDFIPENLDDSDDLTDDESDNDLDNNNNNNNNSNSKYLQPLEVMSQFKLLWENEIGIMDLMWGNREIKHINNLSLNGWEKFFLFVLPVTPTRFRPPIFMNGLQFDHPQNTYLNKILNLSEQILSGEKIKHENGVIKEINNINIQNKIQLWIDLQLNINSLYDSTKNKNSAIAPPGIKQLIEKKEGLFRNNMMGKRVNYAARSVISPDPNIGTNEIGVPLHFAKTLTYPEPITEWNIDKMRQLVINGPDIHPGANYIENEYGRLIDLSKRTPHQRLAISKTLLTKSIDLSRNIQNNMNQNNNTTCLNIGIKKVWRHLHSGDIVLMNRQPTLHKPSMMAHTCRVLTNPNMQTIRMHYANCNTYNADFDGDEMNMHFPQNELARAEAYNIASNDNQYIVPTDGTPLRGLIQDHVDAGVQITKKDTFLDKDLYIQLLYNGMQYMENINNINNNHVHSHLDIIQPAILLPKPLWTGKQLITNILKHLSKNLPPLNLISQAKIKDDLFGKEHQEHIVIFNDGELIQGVLDKNQFGASSYGLVHAVYEIYGKHMANYLLTSLGQLFTTYLQYSGHTCALEDLLLTKEAEINRLQLINQSIINGQYAYAEYAELNELIQKNKLNNPILNTFNNNQIFNTNEKQLIRNKMQINMANDLNNEYAKGLDAHIMKFVHSSNSEIIKACLPKGQLKPFPSNCFSLMVLTGAKGSMVNQTQISCGLGQQALEGRRVPILVSGRSLPSFEPYDASPRSGGYITDRFLTGLRPQEYYYHCMAGREGLVDTAVKTSRSGYLQRCLVKHLEDLKVHYDHTVRDSNNNIIQFLYGEDGIDPIESGFLSGKDEQMNFLAMNHKGISYKYNINHNLFQYFNKDGFKPIEKHKEIYKFKKKLIHTTTSTTNNIHNNISLYKSNTRIYARRLIHLNNKWIRGNIQKGWFEAKIIKVNQINNDYFFTIQYKKPNQCIIENVPFKIYCTNHTTNNNTNIMDGYINIIKLYYPDPVIHQLELNKHIGMISESMQDKLIDYNNRNPSNILSNNMINHPNHTNKSKKSKKHKTIKQINNDNHTNDNKGILPKAFELLFWIKYMRSLCQPGENVGTLAAQSIGEPSTQMTLNTFHLAGHGAANVTLGIPRLREIIMTASKNIKTPSMIIPLLPNINKNDIKIIQQDLNRISINMLLYSTNINDSSIKVYDEIKKNNNNTMYHREYTIHLTFYSIQMIKKIFGIHKKEMYHTIGKKFIPKLLQMITKELRKTEKNSISINNISTNQLLQEENDINKEIDEIRLNKINNNINHHLNDSDEDDNDNDNDNEDLDRNEEGTLNIGRKNEIKGYDDIDNDSDNNNNNNLDSDDDNDSNNETNKIKKKIKNKHKMIIITSDDEDETNINKKKSKFNIFSNNNNNNNNDKDIVNIEVSGTCLKYPSLRYCSFNKKTSTILIKLNYPLKIKKLLLIPMIEKLSNLCFIRECPGITRSLYIKHRIHNNDKNEIPCIQTEGLNFERIWEWNHLLDINKIITNDVYQVFKIYGIEAAKACISEQIIQVFSVYGINVDPRHLNLLADYMTNNGYYMPLNRSGIEIKESFQQITFETSMNFLTKAAIYNLKDPVTSPSAKVIVGGPVQIGSGSFTLLQPFC